MEELRGWLSGSKGQRYLATDEGWFELVNPDGSSWTLQGDFDRQSASLLGERVTSTRFMVRDVKRRATRAGQRPPFVATPPLAVHMASRARAAAGRFLQERGLPNVMLPTLWTVSREYGEEELSASHPAMAERLSLLQSPEFPMYATLAMGVGSFYCWGRSYRFDEAGSTQHLMEFEQIDIGFAHGELQDMLDLVEGLVRAVSSALGIMLAPESFPIRLAPEPGRARVGTSLVELPDSLPPEALDLILRRLREVGSEATLMQGSPTLISVTANDEDVERSAAQVLDSVRRITAGSSAITPLRPWWRSPLPLQWGEDPESSRSEYDIRAITSARVTNDLGVDWVAEAELYLDGLEIAHAGVFADLDTFLRNLDEAGTSRDRYAWLIPFLEDAPPGMVKVGIGWERLIAAILGNCTPADVQLFPRLGDGALRRGWSR